MPESIQKTIERKLGEDAYALMKDAFRGPQEARRFAWVGFKSDYWLSIMNIPF